MDRKSSATLPLLVCLLCLHVIGLFIFTKGFLLTRVELELYSNCADFSLHGNWRQSAETTQAFGGSKSSQAGSTGSSEARQDVESSVEEHTEPSEGCWTRPQVRKVVIIVIDAMRFDFAANVSDYHHPRGPWVGRLPIFERLVAEKGASAALFKFVADPPTTSLQRLKGLTTGGLPTFIDIGNSFGAPAITEDNLISQLAQQGRRLVLLGDDTWMDLYPTQFTEAHPYPSFVVKDIHTVDNGVIKEIFPALKHDDWDVLIGHFLGVDHVGHTFDVGSPIMLEKLDQMNSVLEDVVSALQAESPGLHEDTLLIVMGDHAQTLSGDHGGGTPEEVDTALFALSMRSPRVNLPAGLRSPPCSSADAEGRASKCVSTLPQVDFAPTLAMLLGVPIPYASVGKVNPELWALCPYTWTATSTVRPSSCCSHPSADKCPCRKSGGCKQKGAEKSSSGGVTRVECGRSPEEKVAEMGYCASTEGGVSSQGGGGGCGLVGEKEGAPAKASGPPGTGSVRRGELENPGGLAGESANAGALQGMRASDNADKQRDGFTGGTAELGGDSEWFGSEQVRLVRWMDGYWRALEVNSAQVQRYLDRYSAAAHSPFPAAQLARVRALHEKAVLAGEQLHLGGTDRFLRSAEESGEAQKSSGAAVSGRGLESGAGFGFCWVDSPGVEKELGSSSVRAHTDEVGQQEGAAESAGAVHSGKRTRHRATAGDEEESGGEMEGSNGRMGWEASSDALHRAIAAHMEHLTQAAELARAQWTQFSGGAMVLGLVVLAASLLAHALAFFSLVLNPQTLLSFPWAKTVSAAVCACFTAGASAFFIPPLVEGNDNLPLQKALRSGAGDGVNAFAVGSGVAALASVALLCWHVVKRHVPLGQGVEVDGTASVSTERQGRGGSMKDWGVLLFTGVHAASMISDKCIMAEGKVVVLMTAVIAALYLRDALAVGDRARVLDALLLFAANAVLACLGLHTSSPEQGGPAAGSLSPPLAFLWAGVSASLPMVLLLRLVLRALPSKTRFWRGFRACCALQYALVGAYWLAEETGEHFLPPRFQRAARLAVPRAAYGLAAILVLSLVASVVAFQRIEGFPVSSGERKTVGRGTAEKRGAKVNLESRVDCADNESGPPELAACTGLNGVSPHQVGRMHKGDEWVIKGRKETNRADGVDGRGYTAQTGATRESTARAAVFARVAALVAALAGVLGLLLGGKGPALLLSAAVQAACSVRLQSPFKESRTLRGSATSVSKEPDAPLAKTAPVSEAGGERLDGNGAVSRESKKTVTKTPGREKGANSDRMLDNAESARSNPGESGSGHFSGSEQRALTGLSSSSSLRDSRGSLSSGSWHSVVRSAAVGSEWSIYTTQLFFCTGHRCSFDALQYTAAFVGFEGFSFARSGALLAANTFASHVLVAFGLPLLVFRPEVESRTQGEPGLELGRVVLGYGLARALAAFVTTGTVALLRRHLMVWSIFAPKFVFDACSLLVTDVLLVLAVMFAEGAYYRAERR